MVNFALECVRTRSEVRRREIPESYVGFDEFRKLVRTKKSQKPEITTLDYSRDFAKSPAFSITEIHPGFPFQNVKIEEVARFITEIMEILKNPEKVAFYLRNLDQELGRQLHRIDVDTRTQPQYYVESRGFIMPGPWQEDYVPAQKQKLLTKILTQRESAYETSKAGDIVFTSHVGLQEADDFVAGNNLFKEDEMSNNLILHGKFPHKLAFEIFRQAIKYGAINPILICEDGTEIDITRRIPEFFIAIRVFVNTKEHKGHDMNLWQVLIDNLSDIILSSDEEVFAQSNFSATSLNFNIMTILAQDLPNLSFYLLDNFYKHILQMVANARILDREGELSDLSDTEIARFAIISLACDQTFEVGSINPHCLTFHSQFREYRYQTARGFFSPHIALKTEIEDQEPYQSRTEYLQRKQAKEQLRKDSSEEAKQQRHLTTQNLEIVFKHHQELVISNFQNSYNSNILFKILYKCYHVEEYSHNQTTWVAEFKITENPTLLIAYTQDHLAIFDREKLLQISDSQSISESFLDPELSLKLLLKYIVNTLEKHQPVENKSLRIRFFLENDSLKIQVRDKICEICNIQNLKESDEEEFFYFPSIDDSILLEATRFPGKDTTLQTPTASQLQTQAKEKD